MNTADCLDLVLVLIDICAPACKCHFDNEDDPCYKRIPLSLVLGCRCAPGGLQLAWRHQLCSDQRILCARAPQSTVGDTGICAESSSEMCFWL